MPMNWPFSLLLFSELTDLGALSKCPTTNLQNCWSKRPALKLQPEWMEMDGSTHKRPIKWDHSHKSPKRWLKSTVAVASSFTLFQLTRIRFHEAVNTSEQCCAWPYVTCKERCGWLHFCRSTKRSLLEWYLSSYPGRTGGNAFGDS